MIVELEAGLHDAHLPALRKREKAGKKGGRKGALDAIEGRERKLRTDALRTELGVDWDLHA